MDTPMNQPVVRDRCPPPKSVADTEIELNSLLRLLLKTVYVRGLENASQLSSALKLPISVVNELLEEAKERGVLEVLGAAGQRLSAEFRYGITERGRQWASDALDQSLYAGPAPVSLADFHRQIERQRVTEEQVQPDNLVKALSDLVVSRSMIRALGPAVNSGRSVLLYGSPGNGKTTIASILGGVFTDIIHIPYCIEIDGQIIKVFDPTLHQPMEDLTEDLTGAVSEEVSLRTETIDRRWVACKRPLVITGGELTLAMLDLNFNPYSRFYEAPLHMKAIGGTYVIDDLGRQLVRPDDLLNRWIGPMETRVDYLTLNTGKTFEIPFDELLIFSTNLMPEDIMDPAFLRRIPYKLGVPAPSPEQYLETFRIESSSMGIDYDDDIGRYILREVTERFEQPLSFYQPKFILQQVYHACRFEGRDPELTEEYIHEAEDLGMTRFTYSWDKEQKKGRGDEDWVPPDGA
jgi:energy-coupling factor transporter ATP-binding protein EcfA2